MTTTSPIARDFANLLSARRLLGKLAGNEQPEQARDRSARWIDSFATQTSSGVSVADGVRTFTPFEVRDTREVFYLHGGGLVHYSTAVFTTFLSALSDATGRVIRAFDYPKAPETPMADIVDHLERALANALVAVAEPPELMGDSVGGLLALYFSQRRFAASFSRLHLIYPVLAMHHEFASHRQYGAGYLLDTSTLANFAAHWQPWCDAERFNPLTDDFPFGTMPPCELHSAGCDVLRDEAQAFAERAARHQASVNLHIHADLPHDFCLYVGKLDSAKRGVATIASVLTNSPKKGHFDER